ncbi:hypothetical protein EG329_014134 [Mollisiaceae sp. DMI_Dod_QoI]|nr:hypothetical protein EG329_014134 [Helotiales sp. DMI_Dod_QoI]
MGYYSDMIGPESPSWAEFGAFPDGNGGFIKPEEPSDPFASALPSMVSPSFITVASPSHPDFTQSTDANAAMHQAEYPVANEMLTIDPANLHPAANEMLTIDPANLANPNPNDHWYDDFNFATPQRSPITPSDWAARHTLPEDFFNAPVTPLDGTFDFDFGDNATENTTKQGGMAAGISAQPTNTASMNVNASSVTPATTFGQGTQNTVAKDAHATPVGNVPVMNVEKPVEAHKTRATPVPNAIEKTVEKGGAMPEAADECTLLSYCGPYGLQPTVYAPRAAPDVGTIASRAIANQPTTYQSDLSNQQDGGNSPPNHNQPRGLVNNLVDANNNVLAGIQSAPGSTTPIVNQVQGSAALAAFEAQAAGSMATAPTFQQQGLFLPGGGSQSGGSSSSSPAKGQPRQRGRPRGKTQGSPKASPKASPKTKASPKASPKNKAASGKKAGNGFSTPVTFTDEELASIPPQHYSPFVLKSLPPEFVAQFHVPAENEYNDQTPLYRPIHRPNSMVAAPMSQPQGTAIPPSAFRVQAFGVDHVYEGFEDMMAAGGPEVLTPEYIEKSVTPEAREQAARILEVLGVSKSSMAGEGLANCVPNWEAENVYLDRTKLAAAGIHYESRESGPGVEKAKKMVAEYKAHVQAGRKEEAKKVLNDMVAEKNGPDAMTVFVEVSDMGEEAKKALGIAKYPALPSVTRPGPPGVDPADMSPQAQAFRQQWFNDWKTNHQRKSSQENLMRKAAMAYEMAVSPQKRKGSPDQEGTPAKKRASPARKGSPPAGLGDGQLRQLTNAVERLSAQVTILQGEVALLKANQN